MDVYEDMFKEITKKIYGQDTPSSPKERRLAEQDAYKMVEKGLSMINNDEAATEAAKSFGEQEQPKENPWVTSDETISWTTSKIGSYNADRKLFKCQECESVGLLSSVAEHWLGTHADVKVFQCPQCPYASAWARCIRIHMSRQHNVVADNGPTGQRTAGRSPWKESPVLREVTGYLGRLKAAADKAVAENMAATKAAAAAAVTAAAAAAAAAVESDDEMEISAADSETQTAQKRFNCNYCPYATDRRDLHIRHENIHKDNKPFQCDVCQKQFTRADHVKKHYTRMHREYEYCLSRVKRDPYGKIGLQQQQPRVTLYSGDPQPIEPESQITVTQTNDVRSPTPAAPIITAAPLILKDDQQQQQQQQQTVVNIAVVNFNEQTGTHTIQIPIPTSQLKPVIFAPKTILTVDPVRIMPTDAPTASIMPTDPPITAMIPTNAPRIATMIPTDASSTVIMPTNASSTVIMPTNAPSTVIMPTNAPSAEMMLTDVPSAAMMPVDAPSAAMMPTDAPSAAMMPTDAPAAAMVTKPKAKGSSRKNFEKRYSCTYCSWSGVDNWGLKRHLNTHMKPYECMFCEYKAARFERLSTHVCKVHSKKMCCRCSYIAQDQDDLYVHQSENNHKTVRSRHTQTSPTPSSPDRTEDNNSDKNDVIVVWPTSDAEAQNSTHI